MPWMTAAATVGSKLIGGLIGNSAAKKAAAESARAKAEAMALSKGVYDKAQSNYQPYQEAGGNALSRLSQQADQYSTGPTANDVMNGPGYQFGLQQGQAAVENSAAARGGLYSGANMKALQQFGTDYATTKYDNEYNRQRTDRNDSTNRYNTLLNTGMSANNAVSNAGENYAGRATSLITGNGVAQANSQIARGNNWQDTLNGATSAGMDAFGSYKGGQSAVNADMKTTGDFTRMDRGRGYADGGMVTPQDKAAQAQALAKQQAEQKAREAAEKNKALIKVPEKLDRKAQLKAQMDALGLRDGGRVPGKGKPRADDVPIMASSGEHVLDVETVRALGGGDLQRGHNLLTRLRMQARGA